MKPTLLLVDTKDDRREIWHLLHRLSPWDRVRFLGQCCERARLPNGVGPRVSTDRMKPRITASYREEKANEGLTNEVYGDILVLAAEWNIDMASVAVELEQIVRAKLPLASRIETAAERKAAITGQKGSHAGGAAASLLLPPSAS